jgi:tRNA dimethylallyltransferase
MLDHLEGPATLEDATTTLVRNTKNFIRRQLSWFRADPRVEWWNASRMGWDAVRAGIAARFGDALSVS